MYKNILSNCKKNGNNHKWYIYTMEYREELIIMMKCISVHTEII